MVQALDWTGVTNAENQANAPAPQALGADQRNILRSTLAAQGQTGLQSSLGSLAQGGVTSPLYAQQSARMRAGTSANTSGQMAQIDVANVDKQNALDMQQRSQALTAGNLALGQQGVIQGANQAANTLAEGKRQFNVSSANSLKQYLMSLAGGGSGGGAGAGGAGGPSAGSMAGNMEPIYTYAEATGELPGSALLYNRWMKQQIKRSMADPYNNQGFNLQNQRMQQLLQMFGGG